MKRLFLGTLYVVLGTVLVASVAVASSWFNGNQPDIGRLFDSDHVSHSIYTATSSTGLPWTSNPLGEYTLYQKTIPGGTMGENGSLLVDFFVSMSSVTTQRNTRLYLGNTGFATLGINHATVKHVSISGTKKLVNVTSQTQVAGGLYSWAIYGGPDGTAKSNYTIDTTIDQVLKITGQTILGLAAPVTAVTGTAGVCTVSAAAHGFLQGEYIQAANGGGCSSGSPNADPAQLISALTNTFTYACLCSGTATTFPTIKLYPNITLQWADVEIKRK